MQENAIQILTECKALLKGHFLLSSGLHSDSYCQCAKLLQYPDKAAQVLAIVTEKIKDLGADLLVGPAMGGVIVAYELARQLTAYKQSQNRTEAQAPVVPGIFTERKDGLMCLTRGFEIKQGQNVLITEDVITTGKSSQETRKIIEQCGAKVIGLCCIVDRRAPDCVLDVPVYSAVKLNIATWSKEECPLCKQNIPFEKPGSRTIF